MMVIYDFDFVKAKKKYSVQSVLMMRNKVCFVRIFYSPPHSVFLIM